MPFWALIVAGTPCIVGGRAASRDGLRFIGWPLLGLGLLLYVAGCAYLIHVP